MKEQQRKWLDEQIKEKAEKKEREKMEEREYINYTMNILKERANLESNFNSNKTQKNNDVAQYNKILQEEKKKNFELEKKQKLENEKQETDILIQRGQKKTYGEC